MQRALLTERLRLEPMSSIHTEGMVALHADPATLQFIGPGQPYPRQGTINMMSRMQERWRAQGYGWWALVDRKNWGLVGAAALDHLDHDRSKPLELSWRVRRPLWGKGYATEAAREIARFAFEDLGAAEVYAVAREANAASIRVMEKIGMKPAGVQRHWGEDLPTYVLTRGEGA
jgi:RimJ/RimL family protein N-acetyltransferase